MRAYWGKVAKQAAREAATAIFTSREKAAISILLQLIAGLLIYLVLGQAEVKSEVRLLAAFAPLLAWPLMFLWKLLTVPAALYDKQRAEEDNERKVFVYYLTQIYIHEEHPENQHLLQYGFGLPPEDWMNAKLEECGFNWRVNVIQGIQYVTQDVNP